MFKLDKKRVVWVDIARAIGIFLVVMGHLNNVSNYGEIERVIYTFHMPLFFIISGFFVKVESEYNRHIWWNKCIKKYLISLIIPYAIWTLIYIKNFVGAPYLLYGSWLAIKASTTFTCYWFLPTLFMARIYQFAALAFAKKINLDARIMAAICVVLFFIVGVCLPHNNLEGQLGMPLGFDVAFVACSFMFLGYLIMPILNKIRQINVLFIIILFVINLALFVFCYQYVSYDNQPYNFLLFCNAMYGNIPMFIIEALLGSFLVFFISIILDKLNFYWSGLKWIGANSIAIYVIHKKFAENLFELYSSWNLGIPLIVSYLIVSLVVMFIVLIIATLIDEYAPILFGKLKKKS